MAPAPKNTFGVPPGFKVYSPFPFAGMDLKASPIAMADQKFYYLENFLRLGDGYLRTAWDRGAALYSGTGIISFFPYVIGTTEYIVVFLESGSAIQVNTVTGAQTDLGGIDFYDSITGAIPDATPWGSLYLLISNNNTDNDYWAWDGSLLYGAGTIAPAGVNLIASGAGYTSVPTYTVYGGLGAGVFLTPVLSGGSIVDVTIDRPGVGYLPGDIVQVAFSGGGTDRTPILVSYLMSGTVSGIIATATGHGYTTASVIISGGGGAGATATAVITDGKITDYTLTSAGSGYTQVPDVLITGDGSGAIGQAVLTPTGVGGVSVIDGGTGFTQVPKISFVGGGGAGATGFAVLAPTTVARVDLAAGGSSFTSPPTIAFVGGGTSVATGTAVLSGNTVGSVNVTNHGSGYTSAPAVMFNGGGGSNAAGTAVLSGDTVASVTMTNNGSGYTSAPTVSFTGGGISPASAIAILNGDAVGSIILTSPGSGYSEPLEVTFTGGGGTGAAGRVIFTGTSIASVKISSVGSFYTSEPAVVVAPGANAAAYATIDLMPFGVSGSFMETFGSRVWIGNPAPSTTSKLPTGGNWQWSAAGSFIDFGTPDGGGLFVNSDRFLKTQYFGARQSNGYLYFFGDDSVSIVSNVQTSGSPSVTTFTYQNVDPQIGLAWRDSMQDFGRSVIFGNTTGVHGLYGGNVTKVSNDLDRLFVNAIFPPAAGAVLPSAAVATLFDVKHYLLLLTILDPDTGQPRNVMATWNERDWTITSQSVNLTYIATQEIDSKLYAWGTDGSSLYPLFDQPSASLTKRFDTKFYGADSQYLLKDLVSVMIVAQDQSTELAGVYGLMSFVVSTPTQPPGLNPRQQGLQPPGSAVYPGSAVVLAPSLSFQAPNPFWPIWTSGTLGVAFNTIGMRFTTQAPDFVLGNLLLGYVAAAFVT